MLVLPSKQALEYNVFAEEKNPDFFGHVFQVLRFFTVEVFRVEVLGSEVCGFEV